MREDMIAHAIKTVAVGFHSVVCSSLLVIPTCVERLGSFTTTMCWRMISTTTCLNAIRSIIA